MASGNSLRKLAELTAHDSANLLRHIMDAVPVGLSYFDLNQRFCFANQKYKNLTGLSPGDLIGKTLEEAIGAKPYQTARPYAERALKGESVCFENKLNPNGGGAITIAVSYVPNVELNGTVLGFSALVEDITERNRAEEKIKASLAEKETLLGEIHDGQTSLAEKEVLIKEIHHRVKNNLQVIYSMLSLQLSTETDNRTIEVLVDSQRRVKVMARLHENLYQSDNLTSINARDYLNAVSKDVIASSGSDTQGISFRLEGDEIIFDADQALACGQIISELLSNSLKHAFPNGQSGNIEVSLHRVGGRIELTVADDGKGLPQDFDLRRIETLGLRLIHALTMQLSGVVNVDDSGGTRVQITFPEKPS